MNIVVIDVGTSSIRGILFSPQGAPLDQCQFAYQVETPGAGIVEQDPCVWANALKDICRIMAERAAEKKIRIDAISLTCQRSSVIPVTQEGQPIHKAIMWQDTRNSELVQRLMPFSNRVEELTGARLNTVFSGPKMAWIRENEPEVYAQAYKLVTIADFLTYIMTGEFVTDETYGSRSLLMGMKSRRWEPELLRIFGIDEEKLCRIVPPGSISGFLSPSFAQETGLTAGIPLISAGGDQQCGALGQGVYQSGMVEITIGTGAYALMQVDHPEDIRGKGILCGAHAVPGSYVLETSLLTCAALFNWARDTLFGQKDFDTINREIELTAPGSNGCICIPYFQGRGTPDWNSTARGAFLNLELGTTRGMMARSVLESIAYEVQNHLLTLEKGGGAPERISVGGGLTKQPSFCQILSDVTHHRLYLETKTAEHTARGAWMSAAVTLGLFPDYAAAYETALGADAFRTFDPDPALHTVYEERRNEMNRRYQQIVQ